MDTIQKGRLGYNIFEKELLKRGWDIYIPLLENTKIDCIISKNNYLIKTQIKVLSFDKRDNRKHLPVRKISHNQGQYKIHHYTSAEIDFFIGVDVETEDIYILPIDFVSKYTSSIGLKAMQPYKNNFSQLEPQDGNYLSADDDIGERLTVNVEGM